MKEKQILENVWMEQKDEISWKESENSIYPKIYCAKLPTISLV